MSFSGTFEEGINRLDNLTKELNRDDLTLEESTSLYKEARELAEDLHDLLKKAELVVQDVDENNIPVVLESKESTYAEK